MTATGVDATDTGADGVWANAVWANAVWANAVGADGVWADGVWANAVWANAVRPYGVRPGLAIARQPGRGSQRQVASEWIARLALAGPVHVLDGGNVFDAYRVARLVRAQTHELEAVMGRIVVRRAFTCYQMAVLLGDAAREGERRSQECHGGERRSQECHGGERRSQECHGGERRSPLPYPVVVLELLATFADENVPTRERERLFEGCLADLKRLSHRSFTLVSVTCPVDAGPNSVRRPNSVRPNGVGPSFGFDRLVEAADPGPDGEAFRLSAEVVQPGFACLPSPGQPTQMSLWTMPGGA